MNNEIDWKDEGFIAGVVYKCEREESSMVFIQEPS
jgi:hypothetical protein